MGNRNYLNQVRTAVVHTNPDDDALLCLYIFMKEVGAQQWEGAEVIEVPAGTVLEGSEGNPSVIHFDTGKGPFDQHGKCLERTASALIFAQFLGVERRPAYVDLLEMVVKVDNIEEVSRDSIHSIINGYRRMHRKGQISLEELISKTFALFDIISGQGESRAKATENLGKFAQWHNAKGLRLCVLPMHPELRDAAFEQGADVVLWSTVARKGGVKRRNIGIQVNRKRQGAINLDTVALRLRIREMRTREIETKGKKLDYILHRPDVEPSWFLFETGGLILNGSHTWELTEDEVSRLKLGEIIHCTISGLSQRRKA